MAFTFTCSRPIKNLAMMYSIFFNRTVSSGERTVIAGLLILLIGIIAPDTSVAGPSNPPVEQPILIDGIPIDPPLEPTIQGPNAVCFTKLSQLETRASSLCRASKNFNSTDDIPCGPKYDGLKDTKGEPLLPLITFLNSQKSEGTKELKISGEVDLSLLQKVANRVYGYWKGVPSKIEIGGKINLNQDLQINFTSTGPSSLALLGPVTICADLANKKYELMVHGLDVYPFSFSPSGEVQITMQAVILVQNRKLSLGYYTARLKPERTRERNTITQPVSFPTNQPPQGSQRRTDL